MARRSLQVEVQYIEQVRNAFISLGLTQKDFAEARLQLSRSTVSNFLRGKSIDRENFIQICTALKLDWRKITGLQPVTNLKLDYVHIDQISNGNDNLDKSKADTDISRDDYSERLADDIINIPVYSWQTQVIDSLQASPSIDIDTLVNKLRQQVKADIETRCGNVRILDMSQPMLLEDVYTKVNILEKISGHRRKDITELTISKDLENFNRFNFGKVTEKILGRDAVRKYRTLLILGKPGAGKTTFLKHIVIQCNRGLLQGELVPFLVVLKR